jgi:extracellular elastinolytic metalloproteinase
MVTNAYTTDHSGVTHVYMKQMVNGLKVLNGDMSVHVDKAGTVIATSSNAWKGDVALASKWEACTLHGECNSKEAVDSSAVGLMSWAVHKAEEYVWSKQEPKRMLTPLEAFGKFSAFVQQTVPLEHSLELAVENAVDGHGTRYLIKNSGYTVSPVPVEPAYIVNEYGRLQLVWSMQVEMQDNWFDAAVDMEGGKVLQMVDWVSEFAPDAYRVYPFGVNDPLEGDREYLKAPEDKVASPLGWRDVGGGKRWNDTRGNNVKASDGGLDKENRRPNGKPRKNGGLKFDFELDLKNEPRTYVDAAVTNLFYWNNIMHDITYKYGFDEKSGNFQDNNFGKGGKGGDSVLASAQDGGGYNNANFATPPDGGNGKMRMYVWNVVTPYRDGDLESGIIVHEYCHGLSIRLTGGPSNSGCLGWGESGGMGEGWGDFFATSFRMRASYDRTHVFAMGEYANGGKGIRKFPYSTDLETNPSTYKILDKPAYWGVHAKGEVWAVILYEVYWNLVDKLGFSADWFHPSTQFGNTLMMQIVVDGMKLQPCNPNFMAARDAIILAEKQLTGGKHACELWTGFAKRGLGVGAKLVGETPWGGGVRTESFTAPPECSKP